MENIKTIALRYITFSKDLQLVYFEFLGKRYNIKCTKDIYHELVKFLFEVYKKSLVEENNQLTLKIYGFSLVLYKKLQLFFFCAKKFLKYFEKKFDKVKVLIYN